MKILHQRIRPIILRNLFGALLLINIMVTPFLLGNGGMIFNIENHNHINNLQTSAQIPGSIQWLNNPNFTTTTSWYSDKGGPNSGDMDASIDTVLGQANSTIVGEIGGENDGFFSFSEDPPLASNWTKTLNPDYPSYPDIAQINEGQGCYVYHYWEEGPDQLVAVNWDRNFTMLVDMSGYEITSASVSAVVNGTVVVPSYQSIPFESRGIETMNDSGAQYFQGATGDNVRFYVFVSDLEKTKKYEVASYQTVDLGEDARNIHTLANTEMIPITEESLKFYLTSVLSSDNYNFTLTIGMRIWCEDNFLQDSDEWTSLIINSINLNFTYEKKIEKETYVSWNQDTMKPNDLSINPIQITDASLNFKYQVDKNWTQITSSSNSRIEIEINNNRLGEFIFLENAETSFKEAKTGGLDIKALIDENKEINLTIKIYIADNFNVKENITVSITDVELWISYNENVPDIGTDYQLWLDKQDRTLIRSQDTSINEIINITFIYENLTGEFIPDANVTILGPGYDMVDLNETATHYYILINTSEIGFGDTVFKIKASKYLYETQEISFTIRVNSRTAFIDEDNVYLEKIKRIEYYSHLSGDDLNITIRYIDQLNSTSILNASVELLRIVNKTSIIIGNFDYIPEIDSYYFNLNTSSISEGVYVYTIYAEKVNYTSSTVQIIIGINVKDANINITVNGHDITSENTPQINLTIGELINITARAFDNNSNPIDGAEFKVIGPDNTEYIFDPDDDEHYYNISLNSLSLFKFFGTRLLSVSFYHPNYERLAKDMLIKMDPLTNEIKTLIGSKVFKFITGEAIQLNFYLNNTYLNQPIVGAEVLYKWIFSDGYLPMTDNNDGTYSVTLSAAPADAYSIIIKVDAGLNYEIIIEEFTVVVELSSQDAFLITLVQILISVGIVGAIGFTSYIYAYQKVLKFPKPVRKVRKFKKKLRKKGVGSIDVISRENAFEQVYGENLGLASKGLKGKIDTILPEQDFSSNGKITKKNPDGS